MEPLTADEIKLIDSAEAVAQGSQAAGLVAAQRGAPTHYVKLEYIRAKLGYRAVGGFFNPTHRNVKAKFVDIWLSAHK